MIPVRLESEPASFDKNVRKKGVKWIKKKGLDPKKAVPVGTKLPTYWTACLNDLGSAYRRVCSYVSAYIEFVTGAPTVEHFAPKSKKLGKAYEWSNYRLVCAKLNSRKTNFQDVLDPFKIQRDTFLLNLTNGAISPNPKLNAAKRAKALKTIDRLRLDDWECRKLRLEYFESYVTRDISGDYLRRRNPFVFYEANRQGLL